MNLQELINSELSKEQEARKGRQRSGRFSPSMLGMCYRKQYWNRSDEPQSNPPADRNLRVFKAGLLFEKFALDLALKADPTLKTQVMVSDDDFFGFADLVNETCVYDIKSQHSRAFHYMNPDTITKEKYTNWMQVSLYAQLLKKPKTCLVYISKDDLVIAEFQQPLDGYWLNELDMERTKLKYFWDRKTLPPGEPRAFNGKECEWCSWKDACIAKGEKYDFGGEIPKSK